MIAALLLPIAAAGDAAVLAATLVERISVAVGLVLHGGVALACGLIAARGANAALGATAGLAALFAGPVGALGASVLVPLLARARARKSPASEAWYATLVGAVNEDAVARLCADLAAGRAYEPARATVTAFERVARDGGLDEQQLLLGRIAQRYDPRFKPVLVGLLSSPRPAVRASAAAALAGVRETIRLRAARALSGADGMDAIARAELLADCIRSGVLDDADRRRLTAAALSMLLAERDDTGEGARRDALACEMLLAQGRHDEVIRRLGRSEALETGAAALLARARMRGLAAGSVAP